MYRQVGIFSLGSTRSNLQKSVITAIFRWTWGRGLLLTWDIVWIGSEKLGFWLFKLVSIISRFFSRHYGALFAALTEIRTENFFFSKKHFFDYVLEIFFENRFSPKIRKFSKLKVWQKSSYKMIQKCCLISPFSFKCFLIWKYF